MTLQELEALVFPAADATDLERRLVRSVHAGERATDVKSVRGEVLKRLFLHAAEAISGHPGQISISDADVLGCLDLTGLRLDFALRFEQPRFGAVVLTDLRVLALDIEGGSARSITAGRLEVGHDLVFSGGFRCGWMRLPSATIGGDLNLTGTSFCDEDRRSSLLFDGARIGGRVYLSSGSKHRFQAVRRVSGQNARVDGGILCTDGVFHQHLNLTRCQVRGEVSLKGATVSGNLIMSAMSISSDLNLDGTTVDGARAAFARARVNGSFIWKARRTAEVGGERKPALEVDLTQAHVGLLDDDLASWGGARLSMDGFSFDGLAAGGTDDHAWIDRRITWLSQQDSWSPHPYDQALAALRGSGHEAAATAIAIAREEARSERGGLSWGARRVNRVYGFLLGYGYRPWRFFAVSAIVVVAFAALFHGLQGCDRGEKGTCGDFTVRKADAPGYSAVLFSLDAFLPVDFKQTADWIPLRRGYVAATAVEGIIGWLVTGLLLGAVTGVLRRD